MSSEQVGKHKGAVETLLHEKKELSRILQIVNSQLERHLSALEEAGVDTDQFIQQIQQQSQQPQQGQKRQQSQQKQPSQNQQRQGNSRGRKQQRGNNQRQQGGQQKGSNQQRNDQNSRSRSRNTQDADEDVEGFFEEDDEEQDFNPL